MKKFSWFFVSCVLALTFLSGCGPAKIEQFAEIEPNETAFMVPLEGASQSGQTKFMSVEYLDQAKVAAKRISLPLREMSTGRMWWKYKYIPTMAVIKVNRSPVTREWTGGNDTGTSDGNQALWMESKDSIGFGVGVNLTALIKESDASKFLYYYSGKSLSTIVDENVRGKINSVLFREFAKYDLEQGRKEKNSVFKTAADETIASFTEMGVTITNIGMAEGLVYRDTKIQDSINEKFKAEMKTQIEEQVNETQEKINTRNVDRAEAEARAAEEFAKQENARRAQVDLEIRTMNAQAMLEFAKNLEPGVLPANILPAGSGMLFGLDTYGKK